MYLNFILIFALLASKCLGYEVSSSKPGFSLPSIFGEVNVTSCSGAPSCGSKMASYNGVWAYSNGVDQCTGNSCSDYSTYGSKYQCVELVQRYFGTLYGTKPIWYANAIDFCSSYPSGITKTTSPKAGDAVVFGWEPYGHTAIITSVGSGKVNVVEQNASPSGTNSYSTSDVKCYLTANASPAGSCPHTGYYCGNDGLSMDANNLYYCSDAGAEPKLSSDCSFTCVTMPSGQDDACSSSGSCSAVNTGYYCGNDKISGNANTLYYCKSSQPSGAEYCSNGCYVAPSGQDDYCK